VSMEITQEQAQREATQQEQIRSLAQVLAKPVSSPTAELVKGVVTAYTYPYLTVQLGGDTTTSIANVRHWESYSPVVGDTCQMIKQGGDIIATARVNTTNGAAALNGWAQPTLASGFTHSVGLDPIQWRVVNDHGDLLLQLRGSCTLSGVTYSSNTATMFTLPVGSRVAAPKSVLAPRDSGGVCVKINFLTSGVVQLDNLVGVRTDADNAATATTSVDMQHFHDDVNYQGSGTPVAIQPSNTATGFAKYGTWPSSYSNGFPGGNPHTHLIPPHDHSMANTVPSATWLTGISVYL
jgi:hypothetical protein